MGQQQGSSVRLESFSVPQGKIIRPSCAYLA